MKIYHYLGSGAFLDINSHIIQPPVWGKTEKPGDCPAFESKTGVPDFIKNMDNPTPYKLF